MYRIRKNGSASNIERVRLLQDGSGANPGYGKTALAFNTTGLIISTIADNEASPTVYTAAGGTIETIATIGTFAAPTATKCRFAQIDATNHPGDYELQFADARYAVSGAKTLRITISGLTGVLPKSIVIQLTVGNDIGVDAAYLGATQQTGRDLGASVLVSVGTGAGQINASGGKVPATMGSTDYSGNTVQTGDNFARIGVAGAGLTALGDPRIAHLDADVSSRSTFAGGAVASVTADVGITQAAADKVWGSAARTLTSFGTLVADMAAAVWGALTSGLTTVNSIGKLLVDNINATISSRLATTGYTAPDNADIVTALSDLVTLLGRTDPTAALNAIRAVTDQLRFTTANRVDASALNNVTVGGYAAGQDPATLVLDAAQSAHNTAGTIGHAIGTTGSGGGVLYGEGGSITFTYTVYDVDATTPLAGVSVYVASDSAGVNRSQAKLTDSLGRVQFDLDPSTVYFFRSRIDRNFVNPDTEIVS